MKTRMLANLPNRADLIPITLCLAVVQSGCVSMPTTGRSGSNAGTAQAAALTPEEQRLRAQSAQLDVKSSMQGCVAGAVAGALIGLLAGKDRRQNVLVGAAVGCGVGIGANAYVQSKRRNYQGEEARMAAIIADVRTDNKKLANLIATSQSVISADRRKIAQVDKAYRKKAVSAEQARTQLASVKANRDHLQTTVNALKEKEQNWVDVAELENRSGSDTAKLDGEIAKLKSQRSGLEREIAVLDKQINASPAAG